MKLYAKICFSGSDPGVVIEKKYETEAEAQAFVDGFNSAVDALDCSIEADDHFACVDDKPSEDEL